MTEIVERLIDSLTPVVERLVAREVRRALDDRARAEREVRWAALEARVRALEGAERP